MPNPSMCLPLSPRAAKYLFSPTPAFHMMCVRTHTDTSRTNTSTHPHTHTNTHADGPRTHSHPPSQPTNTTTHPNHPQTTHPPTTRPLPSSLAPLPWSALTSSGQRGAL